MNIKGGIFCHPFITANFLFGLRSPSLFDTAFYSFDTKKYFLVSSLSHFNLYKFEPGEMNVQVFICIYFVVVGE